MHPTGGVCIVLNCSHELLSLPCIAHKKKVLVATSILVRQVCCYGQGATLYCCLCPAAV
jgi:hypothetical protein